MVDEPSRELVVSLKDSSETYFKTFVETLSEYTEYGDDSADRGDDKLQGMFEVIPSKHHESNGGCEECESNQRGKVESEAALGICLNSVGCGSVCLTHALLKRVMVVMTFQEHGTKRRRQGQCIKRRQTDGDCHGKTELAVEHTGSARHE